MKIKGKWRYLYGGIDGEGDRLDIWLGKEGDNDWGYGFMKGVIKEFGKGEKVIRDEGGWRKVGMGKVIKGFKVKGECDCRWKYVNKVIEEDEGDIKVRKRRYESMNRGKNSLKGIECI